MKKTIVFFVVSICLLFTTVAYATIRLPAVLSSNMVLQQKSEVTLWGWADAREKITIKAGWDTATYAITTANSAKWLVKIKTTGAGGPYTISFSGRNKIVLENIMLGEVWLCSGQSNMEWSGNQNLAESLNEMPYATNPNIRFFHIPRTTAEYPQEDVKATWKVCNPEDMKQFSAIGYFFGKKLQAELNVPVGLINSSWGGTSAEVWTPKELVENEPVLKEAATKLKPNPGWPHTPGYTYNGMIHPIINFNIAGTIWYQGESNVVTYSTYQQIFTTMIDSWRKAWKNDFPFYYVQIAPFADGNMYDRLLLREAQTRSMSFPKTGMVVISDLVENIKNLHPIQKKEVAMRLANWALAEMYGKKEIVYKSPQYKNFKIEKDKIRIFFDHAENGLISKGGEPVEFYIAADDQKFLPAKAKIDGNMVIVFNSAIKKPVAVRFAYRNDAIPNLFNKEGLPVNVFRTDNWELKPLQN